VDSNDVERHTHKATTPTKKGRKSPIKAWNELVTKAELFREANAVAARQAGTGK